MQTKVTPRQKMKRQVNFIFLANCISQTMDKENVNIGTYAVVDPGEGPGVPSPSLFPLLLDQTEARRAKKKFLETTPLPATYHRVWMTWPPVI